MLPFAEFPELPEHSSSIPRSICILPAVSALLRLPRDRLGDKSTSIDIQQLQASHAAQMSRSNSTRTPDVSPDLDSGDNSGKPRKRRRQTGILDSSNLPRRRQAACQPCRLRKIKCDKRRPSCNICTSSGASCEYIEYIAEKLTARIRDRDASRPAGASAANRRPPEAGHPQYKPNTSAGEIIAELWTAGFNSDRRDPSPRTVEGLSPDPVS